MFLRYVTAAGVVEGEPAHLAEWRGKGDGYLWLDLKECDDQAAALLSDEFGFHPQSIQACRQRSHLPIYQRFRDHWFVIVHRPFIGRAGHVHLLQLEQFIRSDALITVHGPYNPDVNRSEVDATPRIYGHDSIREARFPRPLRSFRTRWSRV